MGLHNTAHYLKSHGRGDDTELVHMTKGEVKGLDDLARAKGGSLSINPNTGLKEAGFLSDILPTVVGAGVGIMTGNPMLGAAVGGGLGYATSGGNLNRGIMSGLGAYGGSGLYGGLESAGATALAPQGVEAGNAAIAQSFGGGIDGISNMEEATNLFKQGKLGADQYKEIASTFSQGYAQGIGGSNALMAGASSPSAWGQNLAPLSMLGISALGNFGSTSNQSSINPNPNPGYIRPYTFSQTRNPNYGQPGQPYFNQSYTAQPVVAANQWGSQSLPSSGMAGGGLAENQMYPQSQQDSTQFATPTQMPTSAEVIQSDYDPRTDPYSGQSVGFAGGGMLAFAEGGDTPDPALTNPDFANLALDPEKAQSLYALKDTDPKQYNAQLINALGDQLKTNYQSNTNYDALGSQFNSLREQDPNTWYKTQLGLLGNQQGWQIGQNRSDRLESMQPEVDSTIKAAQAAGLSSDEINSILGGSSREGRNKNVQRIANDAANGGSGFNFQKDLQPGLVMLAAATAAAMTGGAAAPLAEGAIGAGEVAGGVGAGADVFGGLAGTEGAYGGLTAAQQAAAIQAAGTTGATGAAVAPGVSSSTLGNTAGLSTADLGTSPYIANQGAPIYDFSTPYSGAVNPAAFQAPSAGNFITNNPMTSAGLGLMGASALGMNPMGAMGGSSGAAPATTASAPQGGITPYQYNYDPRTQGYVQRAASGGIMHGDLGGYSDGGRLLKGPGDGVSDSIPAQIGNKQPARLADGEFVIPARIVSELGNGSTDAGAKQLYKMMDRIQAKRRKSKAIAANTKAFKDLPA